MRWLALASYRDVAVFSLWHYYRQKELQQQLEELQPALHEDILDRAEYLVDMDIFPAHALGLYQKSCEAPRAIKPIDSFFLGSDGIAGYRNDREIGLASPFKDPYFRELDPYSAHHYMFHEITHDVGGQSNKWGIDTRGFYRGITQPFSYHRATEEFFVEHATTISMFQEEPDIIDPDERTEDSYVYHYERKLHSIISRDNIPVDLWGHAYIESRHSIKGWQLRHDLAKRIGRVFGSWNRYMDFAVADRDSTDGATRNELLRNVIAILGDEPLVDTEQA